MIASYEYYRSVYHGSSIPENKWGRLEARAAEQLAYYQRMYTVTTPSPEGEIQAICAMAEAMYSFELLAGGEGGPVQSASIGSVSVSYSSAAAQSIDLSPRGQANELYRCACRYLDIYRGTDGCSV